MKKVEQVILKSIPKRLQLVLSHVPCEYGYNCPICHQKCKTCETDPGSIHDTKLRYGEHVNFMRCKQCNIEIPWPLCTRANTKKAVIYYTKIFLEMITEEQLRGEERAKRRIRRATHGKKL